MRTASLKRKTFETDIAIEINLDGSGKSSINTGIAFLDHMLVLFSKHGFIDLKVGCKGDLEIDAHHTIEDIGIALGEAFNLALGDKSGINRYGFAYLPMDETLARVVVDFSNRPYLVYHVQSPAAEVGGINVRLFYEFFYAFTVNARINLHIEILYGEEVHHVFEAIFKGLAKAVAMASAANPKVSGVLSTKGTL
ncbi:MAG: imidazoleglycerol-phosphate dehydratase HisB [Lentisphaeria bacterium]